MSLTDFLLARITEDEGDCRQALAAIPDHGWASFVLRECEAKRRIVEYAEATPSCAMHGETRTIDCPDCLAADLVKGYDAQFLWRLALPYSDHPDYRQEWKP